MNAPGSLADEQCTISLLPSPAPTLDCFEGPEEIDGNSSSEGKRAVALSQCTRHSRVVKWGNLLAEALGPAVSTVLTTLENGLDKMFQIQSPECLLDFGYQPRDCSHMAKLNLVDMFHYQSRDRVTFGEDGKEPVSIFSRETALNSENSRV